MAQLKHEIPGLPSSLYRPLSEADVGKIAGAAFEVLERSGLAVYSPQAREAFSVSADFLAAHDREGPPR